jgi:hypothetical protein
LFSYATNSCSRNHRRYTLCGYHFENEHDGPWQTCPTCREEIDAEMYGYYGTNEFNFERLDKVPEFEPKRCAECNAIIRLAEGGYSMSGGGYYCPDCTAKRMPWARWRFSRRPYSYSEQQAAGGDHQEQGGVRRSLR